MVNENKEDNYATKSPQNKNKSSDTLGIIINVLCER
jgi:hypothetical protein